MRLFALVAVLGCLPIVAVGQQGPEWLSKLSIHGYISQAYAVSEDHQILGIPTDGTTDYRDLALQVRYDQDRKNAFVLQLRQERLGDSPRERDDVELDWVFYQRNVSDRLTLKAGRIPLPLGIFNEAGGPATTSPFFRPPSEFYERRYTSKTLEGVLGSVSLDARGGWSFDVDGYFGQWKVDYAEGGEQSTARNAWGGQVWANTPLQGVRAGAGVYRCDVEPPDGATADYLMLHASVEADLDRLRLASEYLSGNLDQWGRYRAWYAQAGFEVTRRVSVHVRGAVAHLTRPDYGYDTTTTISEDLGLSINYAVHPTITFKLEGHTNQGFLREDMPQNLYESPSETRYLIASVVASF
ncbi:MAG TPA: hypothetical protein VGF48_23340 [Thermoanaerobaculia bacterium]|jgi:hypothetical protein